MIKWLETFINLAKVRYQAAGAAEGEFEWIKDNKGEPMVFIGNYDKDTEVVNTFPYAIFTSRIQEMFEN